MTVLIISSNKDPASINIKKRLLNQSKWEEISYFDENKVYRHSEMKDVVIITINTQKIRYENLDVHVEEETGIKPKQAIFISRHRSKTGEPTLTTHPIGNYAEAKFGGKANTLTKSSPRLMTQLLRIIKKNAEKIKLYHHVCFEVTHHGPFMNIPSLFVEVGSTEEEWKKKEPADIIAKSILELLNSYHYEEDLPRDTIVLVGIGGGHYAPRFTDVAIKKNAAFGHMIPTYHIDAGNINIEILKKTIKQTPDSKSVYIHKKSLKKSQVTKYKQILESLNIPVISSKELKDLN